MKKRDNVANIRDVTTRCRSIIYTPFVYAISRVQHAAIFAIIFSYRKIRKKNFSKLSRKSKNVRNYFPWKKKILDGQNCPTVFFFAKWQRNEARTLLKPKRSDRQDSVNSRCTRGTLRQILMNKRLRRDGQAEY